MRIKALLSIAFRLENIASRNNTVLNREDVNALQDLARKAPLGSLNGLDSQTVVTLYQTLNSNSSSFSPNEVAAFNNAFNENQSIQRYVLHVQPGMRGAKTNFSSPNFDQRGNVEGNVNPARKTINPPTSAGQR